ncbi:hypothetical protein HPB50_018221 [Hyalomma asiaticum]|uniref:Uncharacterized protein n=1 Tax=Hyalomma asiaticum TaxID=266040 RepID=A0ACB7T5Q3_HYAAI|nr:hypothetical protein HPB50_018221 [Hyalomma asiaticum]
MQALLGAQASSFHDVLLKELFIQHLPPMVQMALTRASELNLSSLAALADNIYEITPSQLIVPGTSFETRTSTALAATLPASLSSRPNISSSRQDINDLRADIQRLTDLIDPGLVNWDIFVRSLEPLLGKTKNRQSGECAFQSEVPGTNLLTILTGPPHKHPTIWRRRLLLTGRSCQATFAPPPYGPGAAERLLFVPSMRPARTDTPSSAAAPRLISAPSVDGHLRRSGEKKRCLLMVNAEDAELQSWGPA